MKVFSPTGMGPIRLSQIESLFWKRRVRGMLMSSISFLP
jgi:hypothetical protein